MVKLLQQLGKKDSLELKKSSPDSIWKNRENNIEMNQDYEKQF